MVLKISGVVGEIMGKGQKIKDNKIIICSTGEVVEYYGDFLKTKHWKLKRLQIAEQRKYTCEMCNKVVLKGFHVHHYTYENLGNELDRDLGFLCADCHAKAHGKVSNKVVQPKNVKKRKKTKSEKKIQKIRAKINQEMSNISIDDLPKVLEFVRKLSENHELQMFNQRDDDIDKHISNQRAKIEQLEKAIEIGRNEEGRI